MELDWVPRQSAGVPCAGIGFPNEVHEGGFHHFETRGLGGPEPTNLEPILEVLEEWAEQLKHVNIEGVLEAGDSCETEIDENEPSSPASRLSATPDPGPEFGGPA